MEGETCPLPDSVDKKLNDIVKILYINAINNANITKPNIGGGGII